MKLKVFLATLIALVAANSPINAQDVNVDGSYIDDGEYSIYLIGDFNDWKLPSGILDNGALKATCKIYTDLAIGEVYEFAKFLPDGKHKLAVYNATTDSFVRIHTVNEFPEINDEYEKYAYFGFTVFSQSLSVEEYGYETAKELSTFEIEVSRSYGMWFDISTGFVGLATFSIRGDGKEFTVKCDTADPNSVELAEEVPSNPTYYDLNGNKIEPPYNGVVISVDNDSAKKLMLNQ